MNRCAVVPDPRLKPWHFDENAGTNDNATQVEQPVVSVID